MQQFTIEEVFTAYLDCRKRKRNTRAAQNFQRNLFVNIVNLTNEMNDDSYRIGQSNCFVVTNPTYREVWAANFRDRVVHHVMYNRIGKQFEQTFIANSCACIKGRGTHYGIKRLGGIIRSKSANWTKPLFYLKMDISNFFVSIQKDILQDVFAQKIACEKTRNLTLQILNHNPTENYRLSGCKSLLGKIPQHKSLFYAPWCMGLPIGNLSSQFFANVYMDIFDKHVVHHIKPQGYIRYVDDFILIDCNMEKLKVAKDEIERVLWDKLQLTPNPSKTVLNSVYQGVDFVGGIVKPWRTIPRKITVGSAKKSAKKKRNALSITCRLGCLRNYKSYDVRREIARNSLKSGHAVNSHFTKAYNLRDYD